MQEDERSREVAMEGEDGDKTIRESDMYLASRKRIQRMVHGRGAEIGARRREEERLLGEENGHKKTGQSGMRLDNKKIIGRMVHYRG